MTLSEQIRVLCIRAPIKQAELARQLGMSPQKFHGKLREERFTRAELEQIAKAVGMEYKSYFILPNGEKIE